MHYTGCHLVDKQENGSKSGNNRIEYERAYRTTIVMSTELSHLYLTFKINFKGSPLNRQHTTKAQGQTTSLEVATLRFADRHRNSSLLFFFKTGSLCSQSCPAIQVGLQFRDPSASAPPSRTLGLKV